jgi:hypothetical protein
MNKKSQEAMGGWVWWKIETSQPQKSTKEIFSANIG